MPPIQSRLGALHSASVDDRNALASELLQCYSVGVVGLHSTPSPFVIDPGAQPEVSAMTRLQAGRSAQVTNLRHEWITLDDDARTVLPLLTGDRSRQEIAALAWPEVPAPVALEKLPPVLSRLARQAFLVG